MARSFWSSSGAERQAPLGSHGATNAYRAVYTTQFAGRIYVLHAFQKKSTKGIATPQKEVELIRQRLATAERHHAGRQG